MTVFERAFAVVVGHEGGFDLTAADPGNWTGGAVGAGALRGTKFGVSAAAYPALDIAALSLADAQAIYRRDYWDRVRGDDLPAALALLVFDAAVNTGVARAAGWLQQAVGAGVDGQVGPLTLAAVAASVTLRGLATLCGEMLALRLAFMAALPSWHIFGLGWSRRLCALPYESLTMTGTD